ncbi:MAG: hypothetical protein ISS64_00765 [Desulfobacterales bacterium]|nr:hypothetical protein [Desulfobacterales bacterium]
MRKTPRLFRPGGIICSSKPLRGSLFSDSVHGIPYTGVCRLVSLPDKVLREKEIP